MLSDTERLLATVAVLQRGVASARATRSAAAAIRRRCSGLHSDYLQRYHPAGIHDQFTWPAAEQLAWSQSGTSARVTQHSYLR